MKNLRIIEGPVRRIGSFQYAATLCYSLQLHADPTTYWVRPTPAEAAKLAITQVGDVVSITPEIPNTGELPGSIFCTQFQNCSLAPPAN